MKVIRGESVQEIALLNPAGELLYSEQEERVDLVHEEARNNFQKGKEKGEKTGYLKAMGEAKVFLELLQTMTHKILEQKARLLEQLKPEIVEFSMRVCERVIRKELSQPQVFVELMKTLLDAAVPQFSEDSLTIVLAPVDLNRLEGHLDALQQEKRLRFVTDPLMREGDCRIETKSGLLNYNIARELSDLQSKVLQR